MRRISCRSKRFVIFILCLMLLSFSTVSLTGCSDDSDVTVTTQKETTTEKQTETTTEETTTTVETTTEETTTTEPETTTEETTTTVETTTTAQETTAASTYTFYLNTNTKKFHVSGCSALGRMKESNKQVFEGTRDDVINMGYTPCGICKP